MKNLNFPDQAITQESAPRVRFAGVSLGGGKTFKTAVSVLEYYPKQRRLFVRSVYPEMGGKDGLSADEHLFALLTEEEKPLKYVGLDAPLQFPKCVRCSLKCPGYENCTEPEIQWLWQHHKTYRQGQKRPSKIFTPYTERCVDVYLSEEMGEMYHSHHALGANRAPLAARAHYLARRLPAQTLFEFHPRLTLGQLGAALGVQKSYLKFYRHSDGSFERRQYLLNQLVEKGWVFLYQQDLRLAVEDPHVFESILGGITGYLKYRGQTVRPPSDFPPGEVWVEHPQKELEWYPAESQRSGR